MHGRIIKTTLISSAVLIFAGLLSGPEGVSGPDAPPPGLVAFATPQAAAADPRWTAFGDDLKAAIRRQPGDVGFYIKDLKQGFSIVHNEDHLFPSASLIKVPVMVAVFQAVEDGRITLDSKVRMSRQDRRGGSGTLRRRRSGTEFKVSHLIERMIVESDNTAAHLLISQLGFEYLNRVFVGAGLKDTRIHPEGMKLAWAPVARENFTTPREMAYLLEKIYRREIVSPAACDRMISILKSAGGRDRLALYMPKSWNIAHKTGLLRGACHDCGIVYAPEGELLVCVLTGGNGSYRKAKRFIASVGRKTFRFYTTRQKDAS